MSIEISTDLVYKTPDEQKTFGFDFQSEGSVKSAAVLSSPVVEVDPASGITMGTPLVTSVDFLDGSTGKKIPAGKGVKVKLSGGVAGVWGITCRVTESTNSDVLECSGKVAVVDPVP